MTEPISTTAAGILGVKFSPAIAGALGSVVTMRSVGQLRWYERLLGMIHGSAAAAYLAPAIAEYWSLSVQSENAVAFLLGVTALNFTAGILEISRRFAGDPIATISNIFRAKNGEYNGDKKDTEAKDAKG